MEKGKKYITSLCEEEDSEFLKLSLNPTSFSSHASSNPNFSSPPAITPLTLSLQSTLLPPPLPLYTQSIPFTSSSSSSSSSNRPNDNNNNNVQYSLPTQTLPYPFTILSSSQQPPPTTQNPRKRARATTQNPNDDNHGPRHHGMSNNNKIETITAPFPWATDKRAIIYSLKKLLEAPEPIRTITGTVECKACEKSYKLAFDLEAKFTQVSTFITANAHKMFNRAPEMWKNPKLPTCVMCKNSVIRPVISKKRSINWLFLFLGQMLGCCTLAQLKYYCKHTKCFRTGSKDRILYSTYMGICEQLMPGFTQYLFD